MVPGEFFISNKEIVLNEGRRVASLAVTNRGDRPVQVGSHFHFFEVNRLLDFDRQAAFGMRLDIPSGTSVRFEPGEKRTVNLVEAGGRRRFLGFNSLCDGEANEKTLAASLEKARQGGFIK